MKRFGIDARRKEQRKWMLKKLDRLIDEQAEVDFIIAHPMRRPMMVILRAVPHTKPGEGTTEAEMGEAGATQPDGQ